MPGVLEKTATPCDETLKIEIMIFWVFYTIGLTKYSFFERFVTSHQSSIEVHVGN